MFNLFNPTDSQVGLSIQTQTLFKHTKLLFYIVVIPKAPKIPNSVRLNLEAQDIKNITSHKKKQ